MGVTARKRAILRHPADVHCVIFNALVLAAYAAAFWAWRSPEAAGLDGALERALFALSAGYLLGWISGVNVGVNYHNHTHRPIFRSARLGRWHAHLWTFSGGWPAFFWQHAHVTVHHASLLDERADWTLPRRRADGRFESLYRYVLLHWPWRYAPCLWRDFAARRGGPWVRRRALKDLLVFAALWSIPWWIDPWMALCLWCFPHWVANAITMGSGMYVQHAGCVPKDAAHPHSHSNSFLSRAFNLTMFNIGYHVEHHDYPQVHWSALPSFHRKLRARLIRSGAHVVPYGYYRAAHVVASGLGDDRAFERFARDHAPGFAPAAQARTEAGRAPEARDAPETAAAPSAR